MEPDLTLDETKWLIHQRDVVKEKQETLKTPMKEEATLDAVSKRNPTDLTYNSISSTSTIYTGHLEVAEDVVRVAIPNNPAQLGM